MLRGDTAMTGRRSNCYKAREARQAKSLEVRIDPKSRPAQPEERKIKGQGSGFCVDGAVGVVLLAEFLRSFSANTCLEKWLFMQKH